MFESIKNFSFQESISQNNFRSLLFSDLLMKFTKFSFLALTQSIC